MSRHFTAEECLTLCNFANIVMKEMYRLRKQYRLRRESGSDGETGRKNPFKKVRPEGAALVDLSKEKWPVLLGNEEWTQVTGAPPTPTPQRKPPWWM